MLTFRFKTDFNQGVRGRSEYGLRLNPADPVAGTYELLLTRSPGLGLAERINAIMLRLNWEL